MIPFIIFAVILCLGVIGLLIRRFAKPRLNTSVQKKLQKQWLAARATSDLQRRLLEGDKVLDSLLTELGYKGSLGEKLKKANSILPNINAVWSAHKLRNRIAHEPGIQVNEREIDNAMSSFERVMAKFIQN